MKNITFAQLLKLGEQWNKKKVKWHNHYFTPQCKFNDTKMFKVTVENEDTGDIFVCVSENHKLQDVEKVGAACLPKHKGFPNS